MTTESTKLVSWKKLWVKYKERVPRRCFQYDKSMTPFQADFGGKVLNTDEGGRGGDREERRNEGVSSLPN